MKVCDIEDLVGYEYHDAGLSKLLIDFDNSKIDIELEIADGGSFLNLSFSEVSDLSFYKFDSLDKLWVNSLSRVDYKVTGEFIVAQFLLNIDIPARSWKLSFKFKSYKSRFSSFVS